jgi:hypothetical protein
MRRIVAAAGIGLAVVVSFSASASAKPGPTQLGARPGVRVWDNSALKPVLAALPASGAQLGKVQLATPPALSGYTVVESDVVTNPNGEQTATNVHCPIGTVAFGGGVVGDSTSVLQNTNGSTPIVADGLAIGWIGWEDNTSGSDSQMDVWAVCAAKPNQYAVVSASFDDPAGQQASGSVACPLNARGKPLKVLGGGGVGGDSSPGEDINTSIPVGGKLQPGWRVDENNSTGFDFAVTVYAICGKAKEWKVIHGAPVINPPGVQAQTDASCPAGLVDVSGGVFSDSGSTLVNLNSTFPAILAGADWRSFENNAMPGPATITPYVVCVL